MIRTVTLGHGVTGPESDVTDGSVLQGPARERDENRETLVRCAVETRLPTPFGEFRLRAYENEIDDLTHLALLMGETPVSAHVIGHAAYQRGERMETPEAVDESGRDLSGRGG